MKEQDARKWLNFLVDNRITCMVKNGGGGAGLFRFSSLMKEKYFQKRPQDCYLFSVGEPSHDVFSSALVKEIRIKDGYAEIVLKGE